MSDFFDEYPDVVLARECSLLNQGPEHFFNKFDMSWEDIDCTPIFLASSDTIEASDFSSGKARQVASGTSFTYGLFEKDGKLFDIEVYENEFIAFNKNFELKPTTREAVQDKINNRFLCHEPFNEDCSDVLFDLVENLDLSIKAKNYEEANLEQRFKDYSENVDSFTLKQLGIVLGDIMGPEILPVENEKRLPAHVFAFDDSYAHLFLKIFDKQKVVLTDKKDNTFGVYQFERDGIHVFFELDNRWNNGFSLNVATPNIRENLGNVYKFNQTIEDLLIDISVSLWAENNIFDKPVSYGKKMKP